MQRSALLALGAGLIIAGCGRAGETVSRTQQTPAAAPPAAPAPAAPEDHSGHVAAPAAAATSDHAGHVAAGTGPTQDHASHGPTAADHAGHASAAGPTAASGHAGHVQPARAGHAGHAQPAAAGHARPAGAAGHAGHAGAAAGPRHAGHGAGAAGGRPSPARPSGHAGHAMGEAAGGGHAGHAGGATPAPSGNASGAADPATSRLLTLAGELVRDPVVQQEIRKDSALSRAWADPAVRAVITASPPTREP